MSSYHRLDVSLSFYKKKPKGERRWIIGAYNAYFNNNPYYIIADEDFVFNPDGSFAGAERKYKEVSLFPIIPSIAYNFKF